MTYTVETDLFAHKQIRIDIHYTLYHKSHFNSSHYNKVLQKGQKEKICRDFLHILFVISVTGTDFQQQVRVHQLLDDNHHKYIVLYIQQ